MIGAYARSAAPPTGSRSEADAWLHLERELQAWRAAGRRATFWWRDDDATTPSPDLNRLLHLADRYRVPLALAIIPANATAALAQRLAGTETVVLQHGWAHENHAAGAKKKSELGMERELAERLDELRRGQRRLRALFDARALPVLVPPWNRMGDDLSPALAALDFAGLSTYGQRAAAHQDGLSVANCHVDILRWRPERGFLGREACLRGLVDHLAARRIGTADPQEPSGLLTHHLVHDEAAWQFLDRILAFLSARQEVSFLDAQTIFGSEKPALWAHNAP